ncbi:MAG TPA: TasA family protein [Patescibacteria group bacterium]
MNLKAINSRLVLSFALILAAAALIIGATFAFFSDTESSTNNNFTAGSLDLTVSPNPLVTLEDFKPGDDRIATKTAFVDFNPANLYLHITDLVDTQGNQPEPEVEEEDGNAQSNIQDFVIYDLKVLGQPDNVVIHFDDGSLVSEVDSCWIPLGQIPGNTEVTIEQSFHFDKDVTNWAQGDILTFTEEFLALQINDPQVPTTGENVWNPQTKKCEPPEVLVSCDTPANIFASSVISSQQGLRKNGTGVLIDRTDPNDALGTPQSGGNPDDNPVTAGTFFSLGFPHTNNGNIPGNIVLDLGEPFYPNAGGDDLFVYEVTGGTYPVESVLVEAKLNLGDSWTSLGTVNRDDGVELGLLTSARYVRLTEASNIAPFEDTADGYDLDAVKAFCTEQEV